jgi:hypothetical protein
MADKRATLRFPTDLEADCRTLDHSWTSRLRNISTTGCMITLPAGTLPEDAHLRLRIKGLAAVDAELAWQHRNHAGVRFRVPFHPSAMRHLGFVLPEGAGEGALRTAPEAAIPAPRREVAGRSRHAATPELNGRLVKRAEEASELRG